MDSEYEKIKSDLEIESEVLDYDGDDRVMSSHALLQELQEKPEAEEWILPITIPSLNHHIQGFWPGELTVVSGVTGEGKTTLCQSFTHVFNQYGYHSLWFSYEVQAKQFLQQFPDLPHFYLPRQLTSGGLKWIEKRIVEAKIKYGINAVFIDHLHYLADVLISRNPSLEIGRVMRYLKFEIAVKHCLAVFLIAHMGKVKDDKEPGKEDLRDSSFVAQEADNVLFIWRRDSTPNGARLKIDKNRRFGVRNQIIPIVKQNGYLVEDWQ